MRVTFVIQKPSVIQGAPPKREPFGEADLPFLPPPGVPITFGQDVFQVVGVGLTGTSDEDSGNTFDVEGLVALVPVGRLPSASGPLDAPLLGMPPPGVSDPRAAR